jgi:hypothetical protein
MKKLLVILIAFVLISSANATLEIGVYETDGVTVYNGRALTTGENLELRIISAGGNTGVYPGFALIADTTLGIVGFTGTVNIPPAPDGSVLVGSAVADNAVGGLGANDDGIVGAIDAFSVDPPFADGVYFQDILFTCSAAEDVTVYLYDIGTTWSIADGLIDSVVIHQAAVPEPMTMALLGLGGLLLRRRMA